MGDPSAVAQESSNRINYLDVCVILFLPITMLFLIMGRFFSTIVMPAHVSYL